MRGFYCSSKAESKLMRTMAGTLSAGTSFLKQCWIRMGPLQRYISEPPFKMANTSQELLDLFEERVLLEDIRTAMARSSITALPPQPSRIDRADGVQSNRTLCSVICNAFPFGNSKRDFPKRNMEMGILKKTGAFLIKKIAVCLVSRFLIALIAAPFIPVRSSPGKTVAGRATFIRPTREVTAKLPSRLKPSDVKGTGPEVPGLFAAGMKGTDIVLMDSKEEAWNLLDEVGRHIRYAEGCSFHSSRSETEYRNGLRAFANGDYATAIAHLQDANKDLNYSL
jgi:hypothetical protein